MNLITREELREKLDRSDEFKLVMAMPTFAYRTKHIPTSVHYDTVEEALAALDPEEEIVVYCGTAHCAASVYAYRLLEREGYARVRRYAEGIADWEDAGYPLERGLDEGPARRPREKASPSRKPAARTHARARRPWRVCV